MSIASGLLRAAFGRSDAARDTGLTTPDDVIRYDGLRYGEDPQWQVLDVYRAPPWLPSPTLQVWESWVWDLWSSLCWCPWL